MSTGFCLRCVLRRLATRRMASQACGALRGRTLAGEHYDEMSASEAVRRPIAERLDGYDAAREASADSRPSSDLAVSDGDNESTLTTGSLRISCLPLEVCFI